MSIDVNFTTYHSKRYDPTRGDVTPVSTMFEMCDIMDYMMSYNGVLDQVQKIYNQVAELKPQLWSLKTAQANHSTDASAEDNESRQKQIGELTAKITDLNRDMSDLLEKHSKYMEESIIEGISHTYRPYLMPAPKELMKNSLNHIKGVINFMINRYTSRGVMLPTMNLNYFFIMTTINDMAENIAIANGYRCRSIMIDDTYDTIEIDVFGSTVKIDMDETSGYTVTVNGEKVDVLVLEREPDWKSIHVKDYIKFSMPYNDTVFDIYVFIMDTKNLQTDDE